ncbi:hypothetical protein F0M20_05895 [Vibrio cholerae]|nr:hypothetical protein F0M20_05895 [Vibrio cholerae]
MYRQLFIGNVYWRLFIVWGYSDSWVNDLAAIFIKTCCFCISVLSDFLFMIKNKGTDLFGASDY